MLRLMVASDSHNSPYVARFAAMARGCDQVFFLGDVLEDADAIEGELNARIMRVPGNCDFFSKEDRELLVTLEGVRILALHGDRYGVKYGMDRLCYRAEEARANLVLFGHTHIPCVEHMGGALFVNPGALKDRRYAEIRIDGDKIVPKLYTL